jgi:hypothetical protein
MKEIIEQLNNLQLGDLVSWTEKGGDSTVIGIVTELYDADDNGDLWKAEFPQDGEHCYWGGLAHEHAEDGTLGVVCKSEI